MINIILCGCWGRMGEAVIKSVENGAGSNMQIVAGINIATPNAAPICSFPTYETISDFPGKADVIIDFSHHSALPSLVEYAQKNSTPLVVATTGHTDEELARVAKKTRRFRSLFTTASRLASVLEIKYDLGLRVRAAYNAGDKEALRKLALEDYPEAIRRLNVFARAMEKQWLWENKPAGLEAIHLRHAAIRERLDYTKRTILAYLDGKLDTISELDEGILPEKGYGVSTHANNALSTLIIGKQTN